MNKDLSMILTMNGLDPSEELARHERMASEYRVNMKALGRRRGWSYQSALSSAQFHENEAFKLRGNNAINQNSSQKSTTPMVG